MQPSAINVYRNGVLDRSPLPEDARFLNVRHIQRLCGVTSRCLQWWDEKGIVSPRILRHTRHYDRVDSVLVLTVAWLRKRRVHLREAEQIIRFVRSEMLQGRITGQSHCCVVTTLARHEVVQGFDAIVLFAAQYHRPILLIPVGDFICQVEREFRHALAV